MMKQLLYIILICGCLSNTSAQISIQNWEKEIVQHFQSQNWMDTTSVVSTEKLYTNPYKERFEVSISRNPIKLDTIHKVFKNPYFNERWDYSEKEEKYTKNYPKSFSEIWNNNLITLFENGKFFCINLNTLERNQELENKLNNKKINFHWSYKNELYGYSSTAIFGGTFKWNGEKWRRTKSKLPFKNENFLFQDDWFVVYKDCFGEWGGTVYFFEKETSNIYYTESTCSNSILKNKNGHYQVVAQLGHGGGFAEMKVISDPTKLSQAKPAAIGKTYNGQALGYIDNSQAFSKAFDYFGIQVFSAFHFQGRDLFIVHLQDLTFLAEMNDHKIEIVHPLFLDDLYTHEPTTKNYGDYTLVNLDHYGTGLAREVSVLLFDKNRVIKIDWNENHSR